MEQLILENLEILKKYSFKKKDESNWIYEETNNNHIVVKLVYCTKTSTIYADNFSGNKHYFGICNTYKELDNILELCDIHQKIKLI